MAYESVPSRRLVTQNLLMSAASFEVDGAANLEDIQNLSALIDLYCLYDQIHVLGRENAKVFTVESSEFLNLLHQNHFVEVDNLVQDSEITEAASYHLFSCMSNRNQGDLEDAYVFHKRMQRMTDVHSVIMRPRRKPFEPGEKLFPNFDPWIDEAQELMDSKSLRGGEESQWSTFLLRTFLYLGYADIGRYALTPDYYRSQVLNQIIDSEEQFRGRLLSTLKDSWESQPGDANLLRRVSPFSAIVFARSGKKKTRIVPEMQRLRQELESDRLRLRNLEDRVFWGKNLAERQGAAEKLNLAFEEIAKDFNTPGLLRIVSRFPLNFGEVLPSVAQTIDKPEQLSSWVKFLVTLPIEVPKTIAARRTLINTHQLIGSDDLPGVERLRQSIRDLFDVG